MLQQKTMAKPMRTINTMAQTASLLFLFLLISPSSSSSSSDNNQECRSLAERVLRRNRPEFLLVPDPRDLNNFVTSEVEVSFSWGHLHGLLDPSCVRFYLLEYGPEKDLSAPAQSR